MLRLYDMRTRQAEDVRPAFPGELRVLAVVPTVTDEPGLGLLRAWLLPDLIRRAAESRGLVVTTCEITGFPAQGTGEGPERAREALNIYPPARSAPASEPIERTVRFVAPGGTGGPPPFDVGVGDADWLAGREITRHVAAPAGTVTFDGHKLPVGAPAAPGPGDPAAPGPGIPEFGIPNRAAPDPGAPGLNDVTARGMDPLAVRLALLEGRYRDDLDLGWDALEAASQTLLRWRKRVAEWAFSPSAPMLRGYADAVAGAFDDDLDTPAALTELRALEADEAAPPGARFETFAFLDRLLGLDLARDIGKAG